MYVLSLCRHALNRASPMSGLALNPALCLCYFPAVISAQVESVEQAFTNDTTMRNFVAAPIHSRCGKTFGKDLGDGLLERDLGPGVAEAGMVASDIRILVTASSSETWGRG